MRNAYRILVRKAERKMPFGRSRRRCGSSLKVDVKIIGCNDADWIHLAQDWNQLPAFVKTVMNLWVS
jgi:hypothetical protein